MYDPSTRRETWAFQRTGTKDHAQNPCLIRLPFNFVEYENSPDREIEPVSHIERFHNIEGADTGSYQPSDPFSDGVGLVARFEIFDAQPFSDVMLFGWV